MIAPEANPGKGLERQGLGDVFGAADADHGFVRQIIMLPNFGQVAA
jgi:hypothetical protein